MDVIEPQLHQPGEHRTPELAGPEGHHDTLVQEGDVEVGLDPDGIEAPSLEGKQDHRQILRPCNVTQQSHYQPAVGVRELPARKLRQSGFSGGVGTHEGQERESGERAQNILFEAGVD